MPRIILGIYDAAKRFGSTTGKLYPVVATGRLSEAGTTAAR
jgi:hypothetical protein